MSDSKIINFAISLFGALFFWYIMGIITDLMPINSSFHRFFEVLGGGYIKLIAYAVFLYGMLDLRFRFSIINQEYLGFNFNLLPTQEQMVISPQYVEQIKLKVIEREKEGINFLISTFIKKACTQFRNAENVGETIEVLNTQISTSKEDWESHLENTRYIIQAIPMLGFVGTIIELSSALLKVPTGANKAQGLQPVIDIMGVAFDTTLVALGLTLILTLYYHNYLGKMDGFFAKTKSYIIDNLISRIYKERA